MPILLDWLADFRYGFRKLIQAPAFLAVALLSLGLGIGANTAIFTLADKVLLRFLPIEAPGELHLVAAGTREEPRVSWNYPDYAAFRDQVRAFNGLVAYSGAGPYGFRLASQPGTDLALGTFVSGNFFPVLRITPAAGRLISPADDTGPEVGPYIVLSHSFWNSRYNRDPQIVGKKVTINSAVMTIIGVARAGFTGLEVGASPDFFMPIMQRTAVTGYPNWNNRNHWFLRVAGRLPASTNPKSIEPQLTAITHANAEAEIKGGKDPKFVNKGRDVVVVPGSQGHSPLRTRLAQPLKILMAVVGLLLLIACANVANLLLARAASREREMAVRLALGAGRARIVRQLLAESLILALFGGLAGFMFARFGVLALASFLPNAGYTPIVLDLSPDWRVLAFTLAAAFLTGILFGLVPALQAARGEFITPLKDESAGATASRGRLRMRRSLVVVQVVLSLVLLIGAGLFARSLGNLRALDLGFQPMHVVSIEIDPSRNGYKGQPTRNYFDRLLERTRELPGVQNAGLAAIAPLAGSRWNDAVTVPGYQPKKDDERYVDHNTVSPGFFAATGIPILLGRDFRPEDNPVSAVEPRPAFNAGVDPSELEGPRVAIVNQAFARKYFEGQNPIGGRFSRQETYHPEASYEIVGVVKDAKYFELRKAEEPLVYLPMWRTPPRSATLMVRSTVDPSAVVDAVRSEAQALDPAIPILRTRTLTEQVDSNILQERFLATLCSFFGILALLLAAIGLYGVMAGSVTRRTREIGIRMALGAQQSSVLAMIIREAALMLILGVAVAIPAALAVTRLARTLLYGVEPNDVLSIAAASALLIAVGVFAAFLPARKAASIDPLRALRHE